MKKVLSRAVIATLLFGTTLGLFSYSDPGERYFAIVKNLDIFASLFKEVNTYYVDEVNPNDLMKVGIDAMLNSLDPYTNYIPEDQIEDFRTMTTGEYGGIGALVGKRNGYNTVLMPYEGYPAHKEGLRIGDVILKIDGIEINQKDNEDISKLLKGQANTKVALTIKRYGAKEPFDVTLVREHITVNNVPYYGMVGDEVGYIKLSDFTTGASREVRQAVMNLKQEGAKKLVIDLRDNPGGLLIEAVNIANLFIPKGSEVVSTKGKMRESNQMYHALDQPLDLTIPLTVLVSSRSASAAEIVAGVLQDYDRAVVIGSKTFGKGLVQTTRPLSYNSQLKVTTAKYYIPSGRCIQAIDYSHRDFEGNAGKVADSLKIKFLTKNGRPVYDGGGIDPDLAVEQESLSPIAVSLLANGHIFDYATEYHARHPKIAPAASYQFTDAEYAEFVKWLANKDYDYTTQVEESIEELEAAAKHEKSFNSIKPQLDALRKQFAHDKSRDLQEYQTDIRELLKREIVSRYYLQNGTIEISFNTDPEVKKAKEVLAAPQQYSQFLGRK
ncbi:S41 family peptidase [Cesiribacter andamanensis]|uniref:Putative CtpA-like serine protease n=1 Tax=Cesiribacter andamanensis AMV16 TaxID=1279009 RepID=M7NHS7_9BACT|nr:S41 family peptidase [Cesiribacter andamanensis]EMR01355.1 putative CtpA-like serine protease [Cesiribacter andamanensis AMV16]